VILAENGEALKSESRYLGKRTNNQAEYEALLAALEAASELGAETVICHIDSQLVCKHLTGEYKVKNPELLKLWMKTHGLMRRFKQVSFVNVPRTNRLIQEADRLVNAKLNESAGARL
jgi:ribonuclease HI